MSPMSPPSTVADPCCSFLEPAMIPSNVDLPTPSGPITPTMSPGGMSSDSESSATTLPYLWVRSFTDTTGGPVVGAGAADVLDAPGGDDGGVASATADSYFAWVPAGTAC